MPTGVPHIRKKVHRPKVDAKRGLPLPESSLMQKGGPHGNEYVVEDMHRKMVEVMAANAMSHNAIAQVMGINHTTLERIFAIELELGHDRIRARVGGALVEAAVTGNVSAMKFWLANRCEEWRLAKDAEADLPEENSNDTIRFYLPENGRDKPEDLGPPTIDGKAEMSVEEMKAAAHKKGKAA